MGRLIWRELAGIGRTGAFWAAIAFTVSVLGLFVVIWGDGIPLAGSGTSWQQFSAVRWTLFLLVMPWTTARCASTPRRDLVRLGLVTASAPPALLFAKVLAAAISLLAIAFCALPVSLLMRQVAAVPLRDLAAGALAITGPAAFVAVVTTGCMLTAASPLGGWMAATAVTLVAASVVPGTITAVPLWIALAGAVAIPLVLTAGASLTYLPEEAP